MEKALGILETYGLLAGVAVADTMVKAANVELIGYELARGQGMTTIKIQGDVGAVKAALASGEAQAKELGLFCGKDLIPRPAPNLDMMVFNKKTVGQEGAEREGKNVPVYIAQKEKKQAAKPAPKASAKAKEEKAAPKKAEPKKSSKKDEPEKKSKAAPKKAASASDKPKRRRRLPAKKRYSCNICQDPKCPRKVGQARDLCIHIAEFKE